MNIPYTNCDCLTLNKKKELSSLIAIEIPDIIGLSEILPKTFMLPIVQNAILLTIMIKLYQGNSEEKLSSIHITPELVRNTYLS